MAGDGPVEGSLVKFGEFGLRFWIRLHIRSNFSEIRFLSELNSTDESIPVSIADEDEIAEPGLVVAGDDVGRDEGRRLRLHPLHFELRTMKLFSMTFSPTFRPLSCLCL